MKHLLFIPILFSAYLTHAQYPVLETRELNYGFYTSLDDYLNDSPKDTLTPIAVNFGKYYYENEWRSLGLPTKNFCWGFTTCRRSFIYNDGKYHEVEQKGVITILKKSAAATDQQLIATLGIEPSQNKILKKYFLLDLRNGEFLAFNKLSVEKLISSNPTLLAEFESEKKPQLIDFIVKYNDLLAQSN